MFIRLSIELLTAELFTKANEIHSSFRLRRTSVKRSRFPHAWLEMFSFLQSERYNKYLINLVFSVRTAKYGSSFFPVDLWPKRFRAWAINRREKTRSVFYSKDLELD